MKDLSEMAGLSEETRPLFILSPERVTDRQFPREKEEKILQFLKQENYELTFSNELFQVYK